MKIVIDKKIIHRAASKIVSLIIQNTNKGIDRFGKPFKPYGTKTFAMPLGAFFEMTNKRVRTALNKEGDLEIFQSKKSGKRWVLIDGGYANLKRTYLKWSQNYDGTVNLQLRGMRGGMLGSLMIIKEESNSATIGFSSKDAAALAEIHTKKGAGHSKIIRDFLGIPDNQVELIKDILIEGVKIEFDKMEF